MSSENLWSQMISPGVRATKQKEIKSWAVSYKKYKPSKLEV